MDIKKTSDDSTISPIVGNQPVAPLTRPTVTPHVKDTLTSSEGKKGEPGVTLPTDMGNPDIPVFKETLPLPDQKHNAYYDGSLTSTASIVAQDLLRLFASLRKSEDQLRRDTMSDKLTTSMAAAKTERASKELQAAQSLAQAVGSSLEAVAGAVQFVRSSYVDLEATAAYKKEVDAGQTEFNAIRDDLRDNKLPPVVGTDPATETTEQLLTRAKTAMAAERDPTNREGLRKAIEDIEVKGKNLEKLKTNASQEISTRRQQLDGQIQLMAGTLKSMISTGTQTATAALQIKSAEVEERLAELRANTEILSSYLQGHEQAEQKSANSMDEVKRLLQDINKLNSSYFNRA